MAKSLHPIALLVINPLCQPTWKEFYCPFVAMEIDHRLLEISITSWRHAPLLADATNRFDRNGVCSPAAF